MYSLYSLFFCHFRKDEQLFWYPVSWMKKPFQKGVYFYVKEFAPKSENARDASPERVPIYGILGIKANNLRHSGALVTPFYVRQFIWALFFQIIICSEYQQNLFLLIIYLRKAMCTNVDIKRTIVHNKCEQKYCIDWQHFDQIHNNMRWNVFCRCVCRIQKKLESDSYVVIMLRCLQIWAQLFKTNDVVS